VQGVDEAGVLLACHLPVAPLEVPCELSVVLQPPKRRGRKQQVLSPPLPELLQPPNRLGAVGRVIAGVLALLVLREVPPPPPIQLEQPLVALAHDQNRSLRRHHRSEDVSKSVDKLLVLLVPSSPVWLPRLSPPLL